MSARNVKPKREIQTFFQKNALDIMLYGYFMAKLDEGFSKVRAAMALQKQFDWSEDDYPVETMVQNFDNIRKLTKGLNFIE